jgi:hypothetical protein
MKLDSFEVANTNAIIYFYSLLTHRIAYHMDRPIVFDLRSIGHEYWKNHICVIKEVL